MLESFFYTMRCTLPILLLLYLVCYFWIQCCFFSLLSRLNGCIHFVRYPAKRSGRGTSGPIFLGGLWSGCPARERSTGTSYCWACADVHPSIHRHCHKRLVSPRQVTQGVLLRYSALPTWPASSVHPRTIGSNDWIYRSMFRKTEHTAWSLLLVQGCGDVCCCHFPQIIPDSVPNSLKLIQNCTFSLISFASSASLRIA